MKYTVENALRNFEFWSGAVENALQLTTSELDRLKNLLPDLLPDEPTDTNINDLFWFDFKMVVELLGLELDESGDIIRDNDDSEQ